MNGFADATPLLVANSGQYEWSEFQLSLIASIKQWEHAREVAVDPRDLYDMSQA